MSKHLKVTLIIQKRNGHSVSSLQAYFFFLFFLSFLNLWGFLSKKNAIQIDPWIKKVWTCESNHFLLRTGYPGFPSSHFSNCEISMATMTYSWWPRTSMVPLKRRLKMIYPEAWCALRSNRAFAGPSSAIICLNLKLLIFKIGNIHLVDFQVLCHLS